MVLSKGGRKLGSGSFGNAYTCDDTSVIKPGLLNIFKIVSLKDFDENELDLNLFKTDIKKLACKILGVSIGKTAEDNFNTEIINNKIIHKLFLNLNITTALHDKILLSV